MVRAAAVWLALGAITVVPTLRAGAVTPSVLDVAVTVGSDDAEESATGGVSLTSSDLELIHDSSDQTVGVRFRAVTIPPGSTIAAAWIQFETDEATTSATSLTIRGQATVNPATFAKTTGNISTRPRTVAAAPWVPAPWSIVQERGPNQRTPDLSSIVQETVNRAGWVSGNAAVFVITGTGRRTAESFNGTRAPALHVEFLPPNAAPVVNAGPDQTVVLPAAATLTGTVSDDGRPNPPGITTVAWSTVSGPGAATFTDPSAPSTTVTFPAAGSYVLRLSASDGALAASDDLTVTALGSDGSPPSPPSGLAGSVPPGRPVALAWLASTDDIGVVGYDVLRDGGLVGTSVTTAYLDASITPAATYTYRVVARDAVGNLSDPSAPITVTVPAAPTTVRFGAAGDFGANATTAASLARVDAAGLDYFLALGDLDYDETPTDAAWCDYVTSRLPTSGPGFPFELVSGNHEDQFGANGYILNHAACLPDRLRATLGPAGDYAAEYYVDYPVGAPLVRTIMIAPNLTVDGVSYQYLTGDEHYAWVTSAIESARAAGIPWVVVGMHHPCLSAGRHGCEMSHDLLDLLVAEHVDLVLQGHDHNYQRGKQLAANPSTCPQVPTGSYDADCVVDDGADHTYLKGSGTVFLIAGTFGRERYAIDPNDVQYPYFAALDSSSNGFVHYYVTADRLDATFVPSTGGWVDAFSIVPQGTNQPPAANAGPDRSIVLPNPASLAGVAGDDGLPTGTLTSGWSVVSGPGDVTFADPASAATTAMFSAAGTYVLRLTSSDGSLTQSDDTSVFAIASGAVTTLDVPVVLASDDAEENPTGVVSLGSSDLELTHDTTDQTVGVRFTGLQIPVGATITAAWIQFETDELKSGATSLLVQGQAADNPTTFTSGAFNISARFRTTASVAWSPVPWSILQERGSNQRTPDLSAVLQEIVARPGWSIGNALALVITGTGVRTAEAYNGTAPPVLHLEYVAP